MGLRVWVLKKQKITMTENSKKTLKRIVDLVITILTALVTTISANAAGIVQ